MIGNHKSWALMGTVTLMIAAAGWLTLAPNTAKAAPDVTFQMLKGDRIELADMRGKPVLINFWATTCAPCMDEMPRLIELYQDLNPKGFAMVGVAMSYDPPNQVMTLSEAVQLPYPVSLDLNSAIADAFGKVNLTPTTFLIDPQGRIVLHKLGMLDLPALRDQIKSYL